MYFKQFYLGCLAHASYLIGSNGEAAVVDPQRDIEQYLDEADKHGLKLKYIFETHLHADFVSGHAELAQKTGAEIVFGDRAKAEFEFIRAADGQVFTVGEVEVVAIHTPGHTPESVSYLVREPNNPDEPQRLLTGDTLFVGEVGRPDLAGSRGFTADQMADMLYDSLHQKIMTLPGDTLVFPAHGAGSLCGRKIADASFTTIAEQLRTNYALQEMTKEEFVKLATENLPEIPQYFPRSVELNKQGAIPLDEVPVPKALSAAEFRAKMGEPNALVLDVRENYKYGNGHVPNSLSIPLAGTFAVWAGSFISPEMHVLIVAEGRDEVEQAVMRLARIGLQNAAGYLDGGIEAWDQAGFEIGTTPHISVGEVKPEIAKYRVIDVRRPGEFEAGHIPNAVNLPLDKLETVAAELDRDAETLVVCRSGQRSITGASILERLGFSKLQNLVGGFVAWEQAEATPSRH